MKLKFITSFIFLIFSVTLIEAQKNTEKQDSIFLREFYIDDVIVSVNKTKEKSMDIPGSLSTINELEQSTKQIENLTDLTQTTPNFHMPDYGTSLTKPVYIRGVGSKINEPAVGLYVDGIPYFEKAAFDFNFYDIKQIEVLRGPQGTLYGRNTLGGIIRVETMQPQNVNKTQVSLSASNQLKKSIHLNQNVNISDRFSVNFGGQFTHHKGYYNNSFHDRRIGGEKSYSGRFKLNFDVSEKLDLMLLLDGNSNENNGYPYANLSDSLNNISYNRKSSYSRDMFTTGFKANLETENYTFKSISSYQYLDDLQKIDQDFSPSDLFFVNQDRTHNMFSQEFNISGNLTDNLEFVTGAFGFYQLRDKQVHVFYGDDFVSLYGLPGKMEKDKTYDRGTYGIAFFGQLEKNEFLLNKLDLTFGLRFDYEKDILDYKYDRYLAGSEMPQADFKHQLDFSEWLPKLSLKYQWSDNFMQFASFSKGYKSGGFNSTFAKPEDETYNPEYSNNYEAGLKYRSRVMTANFSLFYIDWNDQQVYQIDTVSGNPAPVLKNAAESESKGAELELKIRPMTNFSTYLNLGYTHAKFEKYVKDAADNEIYNGKFIPYIPRYTFSTGVDYRMVMSDFFMNELRFHLSYSGIGKHYWDNKNSMKEDFYGLLNGSVTGIIGNYKFSLWGKNLTNANYSTFMFESRNQRFAQKSLPLRVGITLKTSFSNY
jgi:outer membrane receptor protein involved in Fe transport